MERKLKDPELQQHFDNLFALFAQPGWENFVGDTKRYLEGHGNVRHITNLDFAKGELAVLDWLVGYQEMNERAYADMVAEEADMERVETERANQPGRARLVDGEEDEL